MISLAWLTKQEELLSMTRPGPDRERFAEEIAEKRAQYEAEKTVLAAYAAAGYRPNQYAARCAVTKVEVPAFAGFTKKNAKTGKWYVLCLAEAKARVEKLAKAG